MRVRVPFGPRTLTGLVTALDVETQTPADKLRKVIAVLDDEPLVDATWLDLLDFAARYYHCPLGLCVTTALPATLRRGKPAVPQRSQRWFLSATGMATTPEDLRRAPRQAAALATLLALPNQPAPDSISNATLRALAAKDLLEARHESLEPDSAAIPATLTAAQSTAVRAVEQAQGFAPFLLDGVTGSGKTEVYLALARDLAARGLQTLILVPEIGLTPQMIERVRVRTGARVCALHSGLADGERHNAWLAARSGEADIILGTRSAIFVPLARPGLIVVDEEHDNSYKQQDSLRYHARDLAVRRAQQYGIPVVLGSATPALETHYHAQTGRYQRLNLDQRYGDARTPRVQIVDLRGQRAHDGLSNALIAKTTQHLDAGKQVLLFINRRGFAPIMLCHDCGWTAQCSRCDARLISHQRSRTLRCHHCGHSRLQPTACPDCAGKELIHIGQGTQRIEEQAALLWPNVSRLRLDSDALTRKGELEAALHSIRVGEIQLIIGTQMLAKGHDFPNLSLVGIIDADQGLYGQDFRASEHLAQQITQVSGRAGRRDTPGEVLIQTHNPENALLQAMHGTKYGVISDRLLAERHMLAWPPYSRLALIRAEAGDVALLTTELNALAEPLMNIPELDTLGPAPAVMERRGGKYRYQLLLRSNNRPLLQAQLQHLRQQLESRPGCRQMRWSIDVDPQSLD